VDAPRPPLRLIAGGGRARPAAHLPLELAGLGTALVVTIVLLARLPSWSAELGRFQALHAVAFALYAVALRSALRGGDLRHGGLTVLWVALAARVALLPVTPTLSGDLYRYVWEGRVVAHGLDPYHLSPRHPALAPLRDDTVYPRVNHPELATIYPPLAIGGFALVARLSGAPWAMKLWVVVHDLAVVLALLAWMRARGAPATAVIAYAWNPLVLVEYAGSGHNDPTALVWLVLAFLWMERRPTLSALALATGALVKLAPLLALPFLIRRWPWRARLIAVAVLGAGLALFWAETRGADSGLTAYWRAWRNNDLVFHALLAATGGFERARGAALLIVAAVGAWAWWRGRGAEDATRLSTRASFLVGPVAHPWYLGWVLLFEPLGPSAPWVLLSLTAVLSYGVLAPPLEGGDFHLSLGWRGVEYGVPALVALVLAWGRRARRPGA
jgi:hypothetical protein